MSAYDNLNYNNYNVYWDTNTATVTPGATISGSPSGCVFSFPDPGIYTWRPSVDPRDMLKIIRDYLGRAETVDDFIQLIDRLDFLRDACEINPCIMIEEIREVLGLSFKEFVFFKKGLMNNLSQMREYRKREEGLEPPLDNKLFEVE